MPSNFKKIIADYLLQEEVKISVIYIFIKSYELKLWQFMWTSY